MKRMIEFLNKYSIIFHMLLSCGIVFWVEVISRRNFRSACVFLGTHTGAYFYNAFLVFASLMLVYLFRRRTFMRVIITGFWTILGIINGCILSNRVTPFGYTDLKCVGDLLSMKKTSYFTARQAMLAVIGIAAFLTLCLLLFVKGPKYKGQLRKIAVPVAIAGMMFVGIPYTTEVAQSTHVVEGYFANIAQGYENYGFIYGFSSSVVDRGMSKPAGYSQAAVAGLIAETAEKKQETAVAAQDAPNVICVLLESFCDPDEITFLSVNGDAIPTFHYLEKNFSTGYLTVPVVGAGTANSEFEVLSGMSMQYFGTGEYPYKTILKQTDCESVAADLKAIGYGTHAVHNNGGNFYSRVNAFSKMGFDSFTCKEMMDITEWTPKGNWAADDILIGETIKTLDATPDQPDFTYTITVSSHGDYPKEQVIENPAYTVSGDMDAETAYQWTYYVNQLHAVDNFMAGLLEELENRGEKTVVVFFGDHLPTMGLTDEDMVSGDIYKTKYVTWNNMGLEKKDADLYAYQLLASVTDSIGIHEGTILGYHQAGGYASDETYKNGLEMLQYDILYGNRYAYEGGNPYPATEIEMGVQDVVIADVSETDNDNKLLISGENFTKWSKVYVNGEKISATYVSGSEILIGRINVCEGDVITVCQIGSNNTVFRTSNEWIYEAPDEDGTDADEAIPLY